MSQKEKKTVTLQKYQEGPSLAKLLAQEPRLAEKIFNGLPLETKIDLVLSVPWEKRQDVIMMAYNAREIVQAMPEDEIYWTIKQRGEQDSVALVSLTTHEQFQYVIDIDCWSKDRIDADRLMTWFRLLGKCNEAKVIEWFCTADEELLVYSLKKFMKVFKIEEETDISEEYAKMPSYTLDGVYFFKFILEGARVVLMPLLNVVYQNRRNRFYSLIEGMIWDSIAELEDKAFEWRSSRIQEKGFPEIREALETYQGLPDCEVERLYHEAQSQNLEKEGNTITKQTIMRYLFNINKTDTFLFHVMQTLDDQKQLDVIQQQICAVTNRIIMADGLEIRSIEDAAASLLKAAGCISIGLEYLSDGKGQRARSVISHMHIALLFSVGYTALVKLKKRAENVIRLSWNNDRNAFEAFFDAPWAEAVLGLARERPLLFEGVTVRGAIGYKNFERLSEVHALKNVLDIVEAVDLLIFDAFDVPRPRSQVTGVQADLLDYVKDSSCTAVFLTIMAQHILTGRDVLAPLTMKQVVSFLKKVFLSNTQSSDHHLIPGLSKKTVSWICDHPAVDDSRQPALVLFVEACLRVLEDEFSTLVSKKTIDARYINSLILKKKLAEAKSRKGENKMGNI